MDWSWFVCVWVGQLCIVNNSEWVIFPEHNIDLWIDICWFLDECEWIVYINHSIWFHIYFFIVRFSWQKLCRCSWLLDRQLSFSEFRNFNICVVWSKCRNNEAPYLTYMHQEWSVLCNVGNTLSSPVLASHIVCLRPCKTSSMGEWLLRQ